MGMKSLRLPNSARRVSAWTESLEDDEPSYRPGQFAQKRGDSASHPLSSQCDRWSSSTDRSDHVRGRGESWEGLSCQMPVLLRGIFEIQKRSCDVVLTCSHLSWSPIQPDGPAIATMEQQQKEEFVELSDMFSVKVKRRRAAGKNKGGTLLGITIFICVRKGQMLKDDYINLYNQSEDFCEIWFKQLKEILNGFPNRPKSLKIIINPQSHKGEASRLYSDRVAPLFKLADIQTNVTETKYTGHALTLLKECELQEYDGVVCIGGDGTASEVVHGLLLRAQIDAGRNIDSIFTPVRASLPLGIIPAGSTNILAYSLHGVKKAVTATLHIIMGNIQPVDACSFSTNNKLLRFGFSSMFGFGGRTLALAEKNRWMPSTQRREYAFLKTLANLKSENCVLTFYPVKHEEFKDHNGLEILMIIPTIYCNIPKKKKDQAINQYMEDPWKLLQGDLLNLSIMTIPCLCSMAPRGLAPNTRLNDGTMAVNIAWNTSRQDFVRHLKRFATLKNPFSFPFTETYLVEEIKISRKMEATAEQNGIINSNSVEEIGLWNIDGDLVEVSSDVHVRKHNLNDTDTRGVEEKTGLSQCVPAFLYIGHLR
ncbi:hypothetical protein GDO86_016958 [Hymenochirus boettgeri]|uniref:DAGKc domain-containing protein n=1 Tax=Hymenochirus boettgeri TaxID=247094 RepID=A0A8T2ILK0_9PIPI|nr:hypothetical protein GDO86_016958 [Hymenochirus boettgeri]